MAHSQFLEVRFTPLGNTFLPEQRLNSILPKGGAQRRSRSYSHGSLSLSFANRSPALAWVAANLPDTDRSLSSTSQGSSRSYPHSSSNSYDSLPAVDEAMEAPEKPESPKAEEEHTDAEDDGDHGVTLMIRNLPRHAVQEVVLEELERSGYAGLFDLLYVPVEFEKGRRPASKGFGFVHMKSCDISKDLIEGWHGTIRFGCGRAAKTLSLSRAHVQGVRQNLAQWNATKTRRIRNCQYQPLVFDAEGLRMCLSNL